MKSRLLISEGECASNGAIHWSLASAPLTEQHLFRGWKHSVVSWKWQYMEETLAELSSAIDVLLNRFDAVLASGEAKRFLALLQKDSRYAVHRAIEKKEDPATRPVRI